jgi:uncharacterized protein (DUF58 family)
MDAGDHLLGRLVPADLRELLRSHALLLRRPVWGRRHGRHRSARAGVGLDFRDHRPYTAGDDTRRLDWRAVARRDRLVLRQTEAEEELPVVLVVDRGGNMGYGEGDATKARVARAMAGGLAWLAARQGDPVSAVAGSGGEVDSGLLRPASGHERLVALARTLNAEPSGRCPWNVMLDELAPRIRPRSLVVVLSDLLDPGAGEEDPVGTEQGLWRALAQLRARRHDVVVVQVLHRDELDFPWTERSMLRFEDLRGALPHHEGPGASMRDGYRAALAEHLDTIAEICERDGLFLHRIVTDEPLAESFMGVLARLSGVEGQTDPTPIEREMTRGATKERDGA